MFFNAQAETQNAAGAHPAQSPRAELLAHHPEPVAAPEKLAVDDEHRHTEDTKLLGFPVNPVQLAPPLAIEEVEERARWRPTLFEHLANRAAIFDIERALPEAFEHKVVVALESPPPLRIKHPDRRDG